jgi:hypothetical protein
MLRLVEEWNPTLKLEILLGQFSRWRSREANVRFVCSYAFDWGGGGGGGASEVIMNPRSK